MAMATESIARLNTGQRAAHDTILESVLSRILRQASRETVLCPWFWRCCKTISGILWVFWQRQIHNCAMWHPQGLQPSSFGGRTTHMRFKLSIDTMPLLLQHQEDDPLAEMIRQTGLIIWMKSQCNIALLLGL